MKKLIVARHGSYSFDGHLNNQGSLEIDGLAASINRIVARDLVIKILSSTVARAVDSAEHLCLRLGLNGISLYHVLSTEHGTDIEGAMKLIADKTPEADVLVLMTHYEFCRDLLPRYATEKLGMDPTHRFLLEMADRMTPTGSGYCIDLAARTISRL